MALHNIQRARDDEADALVFVATDVIGVGFVDFGSLPCSGSFWGHPDLSTAGRKETQCRDECENALLSQF